MVKKAGKILGIWALVLGISLTCAAQTKTLTILHVNDTHSAMLPFGHPSVPGPFAWLLKHDGPGGRARASFVRETGGIARMAALIKQARKREKNILAFHAGDVFVGSFEFNKYLGYPELKIMENLYDAMAAGNHEFDLGMDTLAAVLGGQLGPDGPVALPLLAANYDFSGHPLEAMIKGSMTWTIDGIKIGAFGLGNEDPVNFSPEMIARFSGDVLAAAGDQAALLRADGCKIVICLSHQGTAIDVEGLSEVPGIDIIVGGHSHDLFDDAVLKNGKIIVQAGSHGQYLGQLMVDYQEGAGVTFRDWSVTPVDSRIKPDPYIHARMNALRDGVVNDPRFGPVYSRMVALVGREISHDWPAMGPYRDAPLGNLVTDAIKKAVENAGFAVDCSLDALGYSEFGIPAGKVVGNDVMRAVPYGYDPASGLGFKLLVVPMYGQLILGGLDYAVSSGSESMSIQVSGLTYAYHSGAGHIVPGSVKIGDEYVAMNPYKLYNVVMTEGIYRFLANLAASQDPPIPLFPVQTGILEYNAVRDYMRSLHFVNYVSEGRVIDLAAATVRRK
jgi:5'-nucleotidase